MRVMDTEQKFFLAVLKRPGDYKFIDVSKLKISNGYNPNSLAEIDSFTMDFSIEEIMKSIKEANIVGTDYLEGKLVIQDNQKHKPLKVIDKEYVSDFRIDKFLKERISNKSLMNNIAYKLNTLVEDKNLVETFKEGIKTNNLMMALNAIFQINYPVQRKFMIYLIDIYHKEQERKEDKKKELIRDKAA